MGGLSAEHLHGFVGVLEGSGCGRRVGGRWEGVAYGPVRQEIQADRRGRNQTEGVSNFGCKYGHGLVGACQLARGSADEFDATCKGHYEPGLIGWPVS